MARILLKILLACALAATVFSLVPQHSEIKLGLAILALVAFLWMTETFHVSITALLIPLLAVFSGLFDFKQAVSHFADPVIWLFMGGFALASALHKQQLDEYIANSILRLARGRTGIAVWMIFFATAFISMWISNTATAAMMLPIGIAVVEIFRQDEEREGFPLGVSLMLGMAYAASIGGIGTIIGTPPNLFLASFVSDELEREISFVRWMGVGLPLVLVFLLVLGVTLTVKSLI